MRLDLKSGQVSGVKQMPSPNCDQRPIDTTIDVIVVHAISLPPNCYGGEYVEALFTNCLNPNDHPYFMEIAGSRVSSHFYIRRDGELVQFVSTHLRAWHAGESSFNGRSKVNDFSIGIELEGCDEDGFEDMQYAVLSRLTLALCQAYTDILTDNIVGHSDISPGRKTDPGPLFDWDRYRKTIRQS